MGLVLFVYLAGVVNKVALTFFCVGIGVLVGAVMQGMASLQFDDEKGMKTAGYFLKWGVATLLLTALIPSKSTMYLMAGAYGAVEVAKMEAVQQVPDALAKTMQIINAELDTKIEELNIEK